MMEKGGARRGGMPLYKFVGNRILTTFQNTVMGTDLTEWHSGYRAYRVAALAEIPFEQNHDGFDFDTQIIIQLVESGKRIVEVPIPTYYGDEICYVNGMGYARDVVDRRRALPHAQDRVRLGRHDVRVTRLRGEGRRALVARADRRVGRAPSTCPHPRSRVRGRAARRRVAQARPSRHRYRRRGSRRRARPRRHVRACRSRPGDRRRGRGTVRRDHRGDVLEHVRRPDRVLDRRA